MLGKVKGLSKFKKITGGIIVGLVGLTLLGAVVPQPPSQPASSKHTITLSPQPPSGKVQGDSTTAATAPEVTTKTETNTQPIPYQTTTHSDANLPKGQTKVLTAGVNGSETLTYAVTYNNGQEVSKKLLSTTITTPAVNEVLDVGAYVAPAAKPAPQPVPQPAPTPAAASQLSIAFTCASATDYSSGSVCVHTEPGASLTITVTYCSGYKATSASLQGMVYADSNGNYTWRWKPETKCPGPATASVTASWQGQTAYNSKDFIVQ